MRAMDEQQLFDAAILFTDMRGSAGLASSTDAREFFRILNASLSVHNRIVREHEGRVVKYTGDGVLAVFRGELRARLALECACTLATARVQHDTPFGIGVAEGRVIAGMVGDAHDEGQPLHYDVLGATVHLAGRLCSMAEAGEVVATRRVADASGLQLLMRDIGPLKVRGFAEPIGCVSFTTPA